MKIVDWMTGWPGSVKYLAAISLVLVLGSLVAFTSTEAQEADSPYIWGQQFGSGTQEWDQRVVTDSDDNAYVTGSTYGEFDGNTSSGSQDVFLAKHDPDGTQLWTRQFGSSNWEYPNDIAVDSGGSAYVVGYTGGELDGNTTSGRGDGFLVKYDRDGMKLWERQFGTSNIDVAKGVVVDSDRNVYVVGYENATGVTGTHDPDPFIIKYSSDGTKLWNRQIDIGNVEEGDHDEAVGVGVDARDNVYVTGINGRASEWAQEYNAWVGKPGNGFVIKYTTDGAELWSREFGLDNANEYPEGLAVDPEGNSYIFGEPGDSSRVIDSPDSTREGSGEIFLIKHDTEGNKVWVRQFGPDSDSWSPSAWDVALDSSSNAYVVGGVDGTLDGYTSASDDAFVRKYGSDGAKLGSRLFNSNGTEYEYAYGVTVDQKDDLLITGPTSGVFEGTTGSGGRTDTFLIKLPGASIRPKPTDPPPIEQIDSLAVTMTAPSSLGVDERNQLVGNPFTVEAEVRNTSTKPLSNVTLKFARSPEGLTIEQGIGYADSDTVSIGALAAEESRGIRFLVRADEPREAEHYTLQLQATADGVEPEVEYGTIAMPDSRRTYVAIGDSTTTGHSIRDCRLGEGSYDYVYGCPAEPGDGPAYPDVLARMLGPDYAYGYWSAEDGDYRAAASDPGSTLGPPNDRFNRVGVWGYTLKQSVKEYGDGSKPDRRDDTPWESQLHAVDEASGLVTVSLGANDMRQSDIGFWLKNAALFRVESEAKKLLGDLTEERADLGGASYMDRLFEGLKRADSRGAKVVVNLYYNPYHEPYDPALLGDETGFPVRSKCFVTHNTAKTVTGVINEELRDRARKNNLEYADFSVKFNPEGPEDHGAGGRDPKKS